MGFFWQNLRKNVFYLHQILPLELPFINKLVGWAVPIYSFLILTEVYLSHKKHRKFYNIGDSFRNFLLMIFNMGLDLLLRSFSLGVLFWFFSFKIVLIENVYLYWLLLFIFEDFVFYILHCVDHFTRLFWAVHVTHHNSIYFNLTTGFRSSVFQPCYRFLYFIPLALFGFNPIDISVMYSITQIYGILVHTSFDVKIGFLDNILVTPSHHRVHHASNPEYLDKNMGMCLIIWDKIFGTFKSEDKNIEIKYGTTVGLETNRLGEAIFSEWKILLKDALRPGMNLKQRLGVFFNKPGT